MTWLALTIVALAVSPAVAQPPLEPYRFTADFENGSVGSWSSYPPAQDTAYDPTIWVRPLAGEDNAGNRALYREIRANYANDIELGVRKRLDLIVDTSSRLRFRTFVRAANGTEGMHVRFAFADGTDWRTAIPVRRTRAWLDAEVAFSDVLGPGEQKRLEALAFTTVCPDADTESLHRLGIDDVVIDGFREPRWIFRDAHILEEWRDAISARHFLEGIPIALRASPPAPTSSATLRLTRALTGADERTLAMSRDGDDWSVEIASLPAGMWRAELSPTSRLVFLVRRRDAPSGHPRLFLAADDRERILAEASTGHKAEVWRSLQDEAKRLRQEHDWDDFDYNFEAYDEYDWLPTLGGYISTLRTTGHYIRTNAVVYGLSGDEAAGEAARQALMKLAAWPSYVHPHILEQGQFTYWPVGLALVDLALGYDMVHDLFTHGERETVSQALFSKGVTEVAREYVEHNRVSSNTSNWISHVTGGGILSALATLGDIDAEALEPHLTGMILKLGELIRDTYDERGGYGEGYSYANFTMQTLGELIPALERSFGIQFPETVGLSHRFLLYQMNFDEPRIYDFGDTDDKSRTGPPTFTNFAYALGKWRDPYLAWLYQKWPGRTDRDLFFADLDVEARPPDDLPKSTIFRDVGTAIFREGFGADDFAFIFRCGPFYNHQHFDQGSFFLLDRGKELVVEVGRTHYYDDPLYQPLAIQAGGHNTILIDGDPESQRAGDFSHEFAAWRDHAAITDFQASEAGGFVSCDLGKLYKGKVESLQRTALWIAPRTIVLIDEVVGAPGSETVNVRFHATRKDAIRLNGKIAELDETLRIRNASPSGGGWEIHRRPVTLKELGGEDPITMETRGFLQLNADLAAGERVIIANVLSTETEVPTYVLANQQPGSMMMGLSITTNAAIYARDGRREWILRGSRTMTGDGLRLTSDAPVSLFLDGAGGILYSAPAATELSVDASGKSRSFTLARGSGRVELDF